MFGQVFTYSPEDVTMIINDYSITGFTDGTFIEVIRDTKDFTQHKAIRGRNSRVYQRDKSGRIEFELLQTSPDNDILSQIVQFDSINQTALLNVILKDTGGSTSLQFIDCYLDGVPSLEFSGSAMSSRRWTIVYSYIANYHVGGNRTNQVDFI